MAVFNYAWQAPDNILSSQLAANAYPDITDAINKGIKTHYVVVMPYNRILDWSVTDRAFRLFDYTSQDPKNYLVGYPNTPVTADSWPTKKWNMDGDPDHIVAMPDDRVLAYRIEGQWSLWKYGLPERAHDTMPAFNRWFAEADPLSRLISMSLYATLTKPRPQLSEIHDAVVHVLRSLDAGQRTEVAAQLGAFRQTLAAIEEAMRTKQP
jgi:hypothetical protein